MDAYDRHTNLGKKILTIVMPSNGRGRELFRPPMYYVENTVTANVTMSHNAQAVSMV
jgi:hypothetical protein